MNGFDIINTLVIKTGFIELYWGHVVMWFIGFFFIFLAIRKGFEPLLLVPIGFSI
ncbi:MAG: sodium ion-translocating decarboxylase subunit beta, partial [Smithella sp.]